MLDRLVGRAILAEGHRIMAPNVQVRDLHESRQTDCGTHVICELEEGAGERTGVGTQQDAVGDAAHGEFAHTEVQLTAIRGAIRPLVVASSAGAKDAAPLMLVLLEPPRSAEHPTAQA